MYSLTHIYTFASINNKDSHKNYLTSNYLNPVYKTSQSSYSYDNQIEIPSIEPSEYITLYPSPPLPPLKIENNTCICKIERNNELNILIIATSISSSLCVTFFLILVWYRFIFKKRFFKWKQNIDNFGYSSEEI
jgi:hypothetical protein